MKTHLLTGLLGIITASVCGQATLQEVTKNGNTTTNRVVLGGTEDDNISALQLAGGFTFNCGINNTIARPAIISGTKDEIRARSSHGYLRDDGLLRLSAGGGTNANTKSYIDLSGYSTVPDMNMNIVFGVFGAERMRISNNGNVGIGTAYPQAKLAVNGDVFAKKIKVTQAGWPDFVFDSAYVLSDLWQLEKFIKEHKHLPEVPSAKEIDEKGLDLGQGQAMLLQKIEELTLYVIDQNKKLEAQQQVIAAQQRLLSDQEKRLGKLEKAASSSY